MRWRWAGGPGGWGEPQTQQLWYICLLHTQTPSPSGSTKSGREEENAGQAGGGDHGGTCEARGGKVQETVFMFIFGGKYFIEL